MCGQHALTALGNLLPLPFDDGLVLAQKEAAAQTLPLGHALQVVTRRQLRAGPVRVLDDQRILERHEELRAARIALPAGASAQLSIDPAALVPVGADHVQAAELGDAGAETDIDAAAGHVRRNGDRVRLAGARHDGCLGLFVARVEHFVRHVVQPRAQPLRLFDAMTCRRGPAASTDAVARISSSDGVLLLGASRERRDPDDRVRSPDDSSR